MKLLQLIRSISLQPICQSNVGFTIVRITTNNRSI